MHTRLVDLKEVGYPILVLTGDMDEVLRQPMSSQYLAHVLQAQLEIYPLGGHALRMQDPDWHNRHHHNIILQGIERRANL